MTNCAATVSPEGLSGLTPVEYERVRAVVYSRSGIFLKGDRRSLVFGRLLALVRGLNLDSFAAYLDRVDRDRSGHLLSELVNAISTNYTYFGRDWEHFEHFRDVAVPEAVARNADAHMLRVWSAAASTGQESYTLAGLLADTLGPEYERWDAGVLGTDINTDVLETARCGVYAAEDAKGLDPALRDSWFEALPEDRIRVVGRIRDDVVYRRFNLVDAVPFKRPFDVIFCRNVMIYFDGPTKKSLGHRLARSLRRGGYLYLGIAESLEHDPRLLRRVQVGVFQRI